MLRFGNNCRPDTQRNARAITPKQRAKALQRIVRQIQGTSATDTQLQKNGCVAVSDPYRALDPFLDNTKVLWVRGRLQNSSLAFDEKHPILLPAGHEVTRLIFENKHLQLKHCGTQALLANTRQQFWTIKGKQLALTTVRRWVVKLDYESATNRSSTNGKTF